MEKLRNDAPAAEKPVGAAGELPSAAAKPVYTSAQRLLLAACLLLGVLFDISWQNGERAWLYGAFWLLALGVFLLFGGKRVLRSKTALALLAPAIFLCLWYGLDRAAPMRAYNLFMLPLLMLLFAVNATRDFPAKREGEMALDCLRGVFVLPFAGLKDFFGAAGSLLSSGKQGAAKRILAGLAIGLPLAAVVLALLVSADDMMGRILGSALANLDAAAGLGHALRVLAPMALLFGFFFSMLWRREAALPEAKPAAWPASTLSVVLALLLSVYAFFAYVQFKYLFGGQLPAELTYSEYARKGFSELVAVSCINFTLFGLSLRYTAPGRGRKALLAALLAATALLLSSAAMRLLLYIGAYRLTFNRIVPLWLMVYLCALTLLCALRLCKEKTPLVRIAAFSFVYWYLALNLPDWEALIFSYNNMP